MKLGQVLANTLLHRLCKLMMIDILLHTLLEVLLVCIRVVVGHPE